MNVIGLDIGTTSICACCIDADTGAVIDKISNANSFIEGKSFERIQSPEVILEICEKAVTELIEKHSPVCSIGITGQMHGVVYIDKVGNAISPLYTWQDQTGSEIFEDNKTYADALTELTGYQSAAGFGLTTCFAHTKTGCVPAETVCVSTIHDYAGMKLCGLVKPVMHTSDAASFGVFDIEKNRFDSAKAALAGIDTSLLPDVVDNAFVLGEHKGIPVCVAIGDNQASFIGSVKDTDNSVLVNVGTGSQMSFMTTDTKKTKGTEIRPCHLGNYIRVGSALCGGRAFAALERFIRDTANLCGANVENTYRFIDACLESTPAPEHPLSVCTLFEGTRENPAERGRIEQISLDNFTPVHLIYGVLDGIADELFSMYTSAGDTSHKYITGSGNGLRKNKALQKIFVSKFGKELLIPVHCEEAAYGAALYSLVACNKYSSLKEAQNLIRYE